MTEEDLKDLFAHILRVRVRRMFGGHGIYDEAVMFALQAGGAVYLKADAGSEPAFREAGSQPFTYEGAQRTVSLGYWRLPDEGDEDPDVLATWVRLARDAARRAKVETGRKARSRGLRRIDVMTR